jgi:hypothetical protein
LAISLLIAAIVLPLEGCSRGEVELAPVQGRITMDGKPLARAAVVIAPVGGTGGPAYAVTDDDGRYELAYTHERSGAVVGECLVRIKTGYQSFEDEQQGRARPETVPARYNVQSELRINVTPGGGPYDFELKSK